jgi:hypothetical protein
MEGYLMLFEEVLVGVGRCRREFFDFLLHGEDEIFDFFLLF